MSDETLTAAFNMPNGRVGVAERATQAPPLDDVAVTVSDFPENAKRSATQPRVRQAGLWLLCSIPIVVLAVMGWRQRWMSDDGMINIRVVDQFVAGNGLVYNLGERVEVATSTLWLGMLLLSTVLAPASETHRSWLSGSAGFSH